MADGSSETDSPERESGAFISLIDQAAALWRRGGGNQSRPQNARGVPLECDIRLAEEVYIDAAVLSTCTVTPAQRTRHVHSILSDNEREGMGPVTETGTRREARALGIATIVLLAVLAGLHMLGTAAGRSAPATPVRLTSDSSAQTYRILAHDLSQHGRWLVVLGDEQRTSLWLGLTDNLNARESSTSPPVSHDDLVSALMESGVARKTTIVPSPQGYGAMVAERSQSWEWLRDPASMRVRPNGDPLEIVDPQLASPPRERVIVILSPGWRDTYDAELVSLWTAPDHADIVIEETR